MPLLRCDFVVRFYDAADGLLATLATEESLYPIPPLPPSSLTASSSIYNQALLAQPHFSTLKGPNDGFYS